MPVTKEATIIFRAFRHQIGMILDTESCWEWRGGCTEDNSPKTNYQNKCFGVAKIVWSHVFVASKKRWPKGFDVARSCDNSKCLRPSHMYLENIKERGKAVNAANGLSDNLRPNRKLTRQQAMEIRFSKDSNDELARRYGISEIGVWAIKKRKYWK